MLEFIVCKIIIKGRIQARVFENRVPEANIWAQKRCEWGVEKAPQ